MFIIPVLSNWCLSVCLRVKSYSVCDVYIHQWLSTSSLFQTLTVTCTVSFYFEAFHFVHSCSHSLGITEVIDVLCLFTQKVIDINKMLNIVFTRTAVEPSTNPAFTKFLPHIQSRRWEEGEFSIPPELLAKTIFKNMYGLRSPLFLHPLLLPIVCRTDLTWLYKILFFPSPS